VSLHLLAAICMAIGPVPDFLKILTFDFNKKNQDPVVACWRAAKKWWQSFRSREGKMTSSAVAVTVFQSDTVVTGMLRKKSSGMVKSYASRFFVGRLTDCLTA
jgi:hypothetical protein